MDPENENKCQRIFAEFARTNRELNGLSGDENRLEDQLELVEQHISVAESGESSLIAELTLCRITRRVPRSPVDAVPSVGGAVLCAARVRRIEPELRQVRQRLVQLRGQRQQLRSDLDNVWNRIRNVTAIRETLQQQRARYGCSQ